MTVPEARTDALAAGEEARGRAAWRDARACFEEAAGDERDLDPLYAEVETFGESVDPEWAREFQKSTIGRPVSEEWLDTVTQESLKMPGRVWKALAKDTLGADHADLLGSIAVPTLLVRGELDEIGSAEAQEELLRRIPDAHLVVYEGIGHALHWEDPARFAADLSAFARAVSA